MSAKFEAIQRADIEWHDGVPYSSQFGDIYYSKENGLEESRHVFIDGNDLISRWKKLSKPSNDSFVIAETGFGTGLNFLLTWSLWERNTSYEHRLHYISCEKYPFSLADLKKSLTLWPELRLYAQKLFDVYPVLTPGLHTLNFANGKVVLTLMLGDAKETFQSLLVSGAKEQEQALNPTKVDAWYLDGFAPSKNETMWDAELFRTLGLLSSEKATCATFSSARVVKEGLNLAGFDILKQPGFGRKREMLVGKFNKACESIPKPVTPWHASSDYKPKEKTATIIGAGLAGCSLANALAKRGWAVTIVEAGPHPASGASGNEQAVIYPNFSLYRSPLTEYMLSSFLYAVRYYKPLVEKYQIGELHGILQLIHQKKDRSYFDSLRHWLKAYPELGEFVGAKRASEIANIPISVGGLFIPKAGWINSAKLCAQLIEHPNINWRGNHQVNNFEFQSGVWHINNIRSAVVIVASGHLSSQFAQTQHIQMKSIRGQMTTVSSTSESTQMKVPLCANGHVLPEREGTHTIGATYHLNDSRSLYLSDDDEANLSRLKELPAHMDWSQEIQDHWVGVRGVLPDYLPVVGPVVEYETLCRDYRLLSTNSKRYISTPPPTLPGLYICAGFGSRGLTTIPLSTQWLASHINHEPTILPRHLIQAINPSRFLIREIIRG